MFHCYAYLLHLLQAVWHLKIYLIIGVVLAMVSLLAAGFSPALSANFFPLIYDLMNRDFLHIR
jgi:hypothetical protein